MTRVAIVTAASRGIGAACARNLAAKGYKVGIMSRTENIDAIAHEINAVAVRGSVTSGKDLELLVDTMLSTYGRIDAVVNNTGDHLRKELLSYSDYDWHSALDLIVLNTFRMAKLVTPIFLRQGGGCIVNISAADAYEPDARFPMTGPLRAALGAWSKLYADQYARHNIRLNCVLPGIVLDQSSSVRPDIKDEVPLGRAATYDEVASAVTFLLSESSSYITGQSIRVDGGLARSI